MRQVRIVLLVIIALALLALLAKQFMPPSSGPADTANTQGEPLLEGVLVGTGLRFDGYYLEVRGGLLYLIRFFPEGKAVLVNGTSDLRDQLPPLLVPTAKGDPAMGYYNVPVELRNDSLFFTTTPEKGTIDYSGTVVNDTLVRFLRHSNINGSEQTKEYVFQPDVLQQ
jgi:hypothetical protein